MTVNYFAYGSNILFARLQARTPSIVVIGVAHLHAHRITFDKPSSDGSGKCGIVRVDSDHLVIGVLYRMAKSEKPILDEIEGVGNGYIDQEITVITNRGETDAFTYYPTLVDKSRQPYDWYKAMVVAGARENELPHHYIAMLDSVESVVDPNERRREENFEIIKSIR